MESVESQHRQAVGKCLAVLSSAFRVEVDATLLEAYRLGLSGMTPEQIGAATSAALTGRKFMPVPAELRELAAGSGERYEAMAERAFHTLTKAVERLGPDCSVNFADGAINATVRLHGGWIRVCELPREEFDKWFRKDFIKTYCGLCRDGCGEDLRRYHGGLLERDNAKHDGKTFKSGLTYRLGMFGSGVHAVDADYRPALPAPPPKQSLPSVAGQYGLELKRIEST